MLNRFVAGPLGMAACGWLRQAIALRPALADSESAAGALSAPEIRNVAEILGGDRLRLEDGGEMRLLAIEAPDRKLAPGDRTMAALAEASRDALTRAIARKPIALRYDAIRRDRYGRRMAHGFSADGAWLQAEMVAAGFARVHGDGRNRYGLRPLLALEAKARTDGLAIWRHPAFAIRGATDPELAEFAGSFQIVAGRVLEAVAVHGLGYVNFTADHRSDLTLVLGKPSMALAAAALFDVIALSGKPVRCRGWIERFDGPRIEVTHPEQIEVLED